MFRTYARIWIGLMLCLFMQAGTTFGVAQASRVSHHTMMSHVLTAHAHSGHHQSAGGDCCSSTHMTTPQHRGTGGCCHSHVLSADPLLVLAAFSPPRPGLLDVNGFTAWQVTRFFGTERSPGLRPPRLRTT